MGLTTIDWVEKAGQLMYAVLLGFFPTLWCQDTFVSQDVPEETVYFCRILANLVVALMWITWIARTIEACDAYIGLIDLGAAIAWGACAANTLLHKDLMKSDRFVMNLAVQAGITAAYVYQYRTRASPTPARIQLTKIDWVEKLFQGLYVLACLAVPTQWCEQNLAYPEAVTTEGYYLMSTCGVLIAACIYFTYVMRTQGEAALMQLDISSAVVWTANTVVHVWYKDLVGKDVLARSTFVIGFGMGGAMLYQYTTRGAGADARKVAAGAEMTQPFRGRA